MISMEVRVAVHRTLSCVSWIVPSRDQNWCDFLGEKKQHGVFPVEPEMAGRCSAFRSYVASVIWVLRWETCVGEVWLQLCGGEVLILLQIPKYTKSLLQDSSALKLLPHITCSMRWFNIWNVLGILRVWWLHRNLWEVWPWWTHINEKNSAVQPLLGSTNLLPCRLLVGFCWALVGWCFLICKLVLPKLFFST